jgi:hypothetical protein
VEETIMSTSDGAGTFTIELPERLLTPFAGTPEAFARELRLAAAIRWLRLGRISPDEAAEVAGLGRAEFDAAAALAEGPRGPRAELQDEDPDMREAAACAMRLLNPPRAIRWLEHRLRNEPDAEVRRTIEEELARHRAVRT